MWFSVLKALLTITSELSEYMKHRQLITAGEYKQIAKSLDGTLKKVNKAQRARRNVKHDADSVRNDPANRD